MDLWERLREYQQREQQLSWHGTFREYFERVIQDPRLCRLSHARIYDMVAEQGIEWDDTGQKHYRFFTRELFGLQEALDQLVEYFQSAAQRLEVRKRILLLMGPVGGGKSTVVTLLKRGLERYSRTNQGALYGLEGCPMHEEPLHLIPPTLREDIYQEYGIYVEGELCPVCRKRLTEEFRGSIEEFPVERVVLSEMNRVGIGTFSPSDPKSQDISELTGSIDFATIGQYGSESDPRAYRFDGELNIANRGLMEFIEMLKVDEKFLYGLLSLSQEQQIKTGRYAMIYADEVLISHTNEAEYQQFIQNKKNEALRDRIILIRMPYNLRVSDEVKIYDKLIRESALRRVHIAPHTLQIASMFAVLSRLKESKRSGVTLLKKLKLYDGQFVDGFTEADIRSLKDEWPDEGMTGLSPRYVINRLSLALGKSHVPCLNPLDALRALKDGLGQQNGFTAQTRESLLNLIYEVRREYDELVTLEVQKAFMYSFEDTAQMLLNTYLDNIDAYVNHRKIMDPLTDEEIEPDEMLMRSIEEYIGVSENAKRPFREEILIRISTLSRRGQHFDYRSHPGLQTAIEAKLFTNLKDIVKITTSANVTDPAQEKKRNEVAERLINDHGYCSHCSHAALQYVGHLLGR
ncbi:PrkA family serine protein kinase [Sulfobacillus thermosulfidooxidans]|uniref:PrkA family serine protein kinase n=1 Tax=Sulfobacillus thermosulfidooxidans TaxID=28034 RepID=UPI0006B62F6E|nr:protein PrkA [Sulfobacillus thermosulfidooxidans]